MGLHASADEVKTAARGGRPASVPLGKMPLGKMLPSVHTLGASS